jgi:hypothetical protein
MNKLYAIDNLKKNNWVLDTNELGAFYNDLHIGFTDDAPIVHFKNLKFGFELKQGDNIKQYGVYPPTGVKYVQSDQKYLTTVRLKTTPTETYELYLWAENADTRIEKTFTLEIPKPKQPYPSWNWEKDTLTWESPIPYPQDDNEYEWDEETKNWKLYKEEIE